MISKVKLHFFGVTGCNFRIINSPLNVETFIVFYSEIVEQSQKINSKYYIPDVYANNYNAEHQNIINVEQYIVSIVYNLDICK